MDGIRFAVVSDAASVPSGTPSVRRRVRVVPDAVVHAVDRRFLSVAIDAARIVQPRDPAVRAFDFARPRLLDLARPLGPAYLRIGGRIADRTFYALRGRPKAPPSGYDAVLTAARWDAIVNFAQDAGFALTFTLNAGPSARDRDGAWQEGQARLLIEHAAARQDPILVWGLGHELNRVAADFEGENVSAEQYARDVAVAARLIDSRSSGSLLSGPACRFWPGIGEPNPRFWTTMALAAKNLGVITWHYYSHPPYDGRTTSPTLTPEALDEVAIWARQVSQTRDLSGAAGRPLWMAETALSSADEATDRFDASCWWVDHLGTLAKAGHAVVVRNALTGTRDGLIDDDSLEPRPDYWASVVWKRVMGREVLAPVVDPEDANVRVYAHWTPAGDGIPEGAISLLVVNLRKEMAQVELQALATQQALAFRFQRSPTDDAVVHVNGIPMRASEPLPAIEARIESLEASPHLRVAAQSYAFFVLAPSGANFTARA